MAATIELTIIGMSGELVGRCRVPAGHTVKALKDELASSFGFPAQALKVLDGGVEPGDDHPFQEQRLLTCVFMAEPPPDRRDFLRSVQRGHHGHVRAMLSAAEAAQRRELLLHADDGAFGCLDSSADSALQAAVLLQHNGLAVAEALVAAACEEGLLAECLLQPARRDGETTLHRAAQWSPEQAGLLLRAAKGQGVLGELLLATTRSGETALHYATLGEQLEIVEMLVAAGRQEGVLRRLLQQRGFQRRNVLHEAASYGFAEVLRALLAAAASEGGLLLQELLAAQDASGEALRELVAEDLELLAVLEEAECPAAKA